MKLPGTFLGVTGERGARRSPLALVDVPEVTEREKTRKPVQLVMTVCPKCGRTWLRPGHRAAHPCTTTNVYAFRRGPGRSPVSLKTGQPSLNTMGPKW